MPLSKFESNALILSVFQLNYFIICLFTELLKQTSYKVQTCQPDDFLKFSTILSTRAYIFNMEILSYTRLNYFFLPYFIYFIKLGPLIIKWFNLVLYFVNLIQHQCFSLLSQLTASSLLGVTNGNDVTNTFDFSLPPFLPYFLSPPFFHRLSRPFILQRVERVLQNQKPSSPISKTHFTHSHYFIYFHLEVALFPQSRALIL